MTRLPYFPTASHSKPLIDLFQGPGINPLLWQVKDVGTHLSLTSAGLTCSGGTGIEGQTTVQAIDQLEMGGSLTIETDGVLINAQSAGTLCGLYTDAVQPSNCFAGFQVSQNAGATLLTPLILGVAAGATFSPATGHLYTLWLRVYCKETQRVMTPYYAVGDSGVVSFGGDDVSCTARVGMEIQDITGGAAQSAVVLYDGEIAASPSLCAFVPIDSTNFFGSIKSVTVTETGAAWVTSQAPGSAPFSRRLGTALQDADCRLERTGKVRFYAGSTTAANELITVTYRTTRRSVARIANAQSIATEAAGQASGVSHLTGTVANPAARSSADCENAAAVLLTLSTSRAAAWSGKYAAFNLQSQQDIWPGDVLAVNAASSGLNANLVAREVRIEAPGGSPDLVKYTIGFANDWAEGLSMKLSSSVPKDAWIPQQAVTAVTVLSNFTDLTVQSVTNTALQIAAGSSAPAGGGFEVRRRDWAFGPGTDSDLVLRSPVANFTIPREAPIEQYFIRQYDGASPPNYSRFSSAIFVNIPM